MILYWLVVHGLYVKADEGLEGEEEEEQEEEEAGPLNNPEEEVNIMYRCNVKHEVYVCRTIYKPFVLQRIIFLLLTSTYFKRKIISLF